MRAGAATIIFCALMVVGCGSSTRSTPAPLRELKESLALQKHPKPASQIPARYVAQIERVCYRYEKPLFHLYRYALNEEPTPHAALESIKRLRARFLAQVRPIAMTPGAKGEPYLRSLEKLFHKETVAEAAGASGPGHLAKTEGDSAEEKEAFHQYESMRLQVGMPGCGL